MRKYFKTIMLTFSLLISNIHAFERGYERQGIQPMEEQSGHAMSIEEVHHYARTNPDIRAFTRSQHFDDYQHLRIMRQALETLSLAPMMISRTPHFINDLNQLDDKVYYPVQKLIIDRYGTFFDEETLEVFRERYQNNPNLYNGDPQYRSIYCRQNRLCSKSAL